jgi:hypothetical protein
MERRRARAEREADEAPDSFEDPSAGEPAPEPPRAGGYRVAAGLEVRSAELEQELGQMKDRLRAMEREVFATRKQLRAATRRRRLVGALMAAGAGTMIAAVLSLFLYGTGSITSPDAVFAVLGVGFAFGLVLGFKWDRPDDNFPAPPPARL